MALSTNLVSYWKLDETSGTRADSVGSNTLTANNSPTYPTGKIGHGAGFDGSTAEQAFDTGSSPTGISFAAGANRTFAFWIKSSSGTLSGSRAFGLWAASHTGNNKNFLGAIGAGNAMQFFLGNGGSTTFGSVIGTTNLWDTNWHFVVITFTGSDNKARIYIDGNATPEGTSSAFASVATSTALFSIGAADNNAPPNCTIDEFGIWSRVLTTTEMAQLYNSGVGLQYPFANSYTQTCAETITNTDTLLRTTSRALTEAITNSATALKTAGRTLADTISSSDTIAYLRTAGATLTENITNTPTFLRSIARAFAEGITNTDAFTGARVLPVAFSEAASLADALLRSTGRTLSDAITNSDTLDTVKAFTRTFTETVTNTASLLKTTGRAILETVAVTDTFSHVWTAAITFTEELTLADAIRKLLNGSATIWTNATKAVSSFTNKVRAATTFTNRSKTEATWKNKNRT